MGDHSDSSNIFHWDLDDAVLNLPGNTEYNPRLLWVQRITKDGDISADSLHMQIFNAAQGLHGGYVSICPIQGYNLLLGIKERQDKACVFGQG